jgi:LacI family transcriptional regulator
MTEKSRTPTSLDVARLAGASQTTVSLVLRGRGDASRVSKPTQERVFEAARTLNYVPNRLARGLRNQATQAITVVVPSLQNPFFAEVVSQTQAEADERGFSVNVMVANSPTRVRQVLSYLAGGSVDGVLLGVDPDSVSDQIEALAARGVSCVIIQAGGHLPSNIPNISIDVEGGGFMATQHLISLGHRRIGYVTELDNKTHKKYLGFRRALDGAGLEARDAWFAVGRNTMSGGAEATQLLLSQSGAERPTAIFAYNDLMAIGALRVLRQNGLRVPEDVAVVGFDGTSIGAFTNPSLTTISHERNALAVEVLFGLIMKRDLSHTRYDVPISLTIRESCGSSVNMPRSARQ